MGPLTLPCVWDTELKKLDVLFGDEFIPAIFKIVFKNAKCVRLLFMFNVQTIDLGLPTLGHHIKSIRQV